MKTLDGLRRAAVVAATSATAGLKACTTSVVAAASRRVVRRAGLQACLAAALMATLPARPASRASAAQPPPSVPSGSLVEYTDEATRATAAGIDFTGEWAPRFHEDQPERVPGPELGDYLGIPINPAARMRGETWEASIQTLWEWQCRPHSADYIWRGPSPVRIWKEVDPVSRQITAWHAEWLRSVDRQIYMDGRPHPSESAPHTWAGFSTGRWEGDMLTIKTTHLKEGYVRRNGLPRSDKATLTEHWMLHGDVLTAATIVYDPVYLTEPFIRTTDYELDLHQQNPPYPCEVVEEVARPKGAVPHTLPSDTSFVTDFAKRCGIPIDAAKGGAATMYPEYKSKLPGTPATCVAAPR